jgi:osmoprotectant transport system permease protein
VPATPVLGANGPESWIWWSWVGDHLGDIGNAVREHLVLTAIAVGLGLVIALPLAIVVHRWRGWTTPVFAVTGIVYTIPSLALFAFFVPVTGLSRTTAEIALVGYTLLILIRNTATGLAGVSPDVREAAQGMGFGPVAQLLRVELPLAVPAVIAGIRIATVTTIGLVTVTALIGQGGLGVFILDGFGRQFKTPLVVGMTLSVALAVVADLLLLLLQRALTPWSHRKPA